MEHEFKYPVIKEEKVELKKKKTKQHNYKTSE